MVYVPHVMFQFFKCTKNIYEALRFHRVIHFLSFSVFFSFGKISKILKCNKNTLLKFHWVILFILCWRNPINAHLVLWCYAQHSHDRCAPPKWYTCNTPMTDAQQTFIRHRVITVANATTDIAFIFWLACTIKCQFEARDELIMTHTESILISIARKAHAEALKWNHAPLGIAIEMFWLTIFQHMLKGEVQ